MNKYDEYNHHSTAIRNLLAESEDHIVQGMADALFSAVPNLNGIVYQVYTPSWNDGDACTQSWDISFDFEDYTDTDVETNDLTEQEQDLALSIFDCELFDRIHKDNFQVVILREEDGINVYVEDYDCGY